MGLLKTADQRPSMGKDYYQTNISAPSANMNKTQNQPSTAAHTTNSGGYPKYLSPQQTPSMIRFNRSISYSGLGGSGTAGAYQSVGSNNYQVVQEDGAKK
jgi:hypothetical protein